MTYLHDITGNGHATWRSAREYADDRGIEHDDAWLVELDRTARRVAAEFGLQPDPFDRLPDPVWRRAEGEMIA